VNQEQKEFKLVPPVSFEAFALSSSVAFVSMVILTVPAFRDWRIIETESHLVNKIVTVADPIFLNIIGSFLLILIIKSSGFFHLRPRARKIAQVAAVLVIPASYLTNHLILKPSFGVVDGLGNLSLMPKPRLSEEVMVLFNNLLGIDFYKYERSTSGGVFAQTILTLIGLTLCSKFWDKRYRKREVNPGEIKLFFLILISVPLIGLLRVASGFHTLMEVAISVGSAVYLFWFSFYVFASILRAINSRFSDLHPKASSGLAALTLTFLPSFFFFSQDAHWWISIFLIVILVLAVLKAISSPSNVEA